MDRKQESLLRWLEAACAANWISTVNSRPSKMQLQNAIVSIGIKAFAIDSSNIDDIDYDDIVSKICKFLGRDLAELLISNEYLALEALVVCAVSEQCDIQGEMLQIIMSMEHEDQLQLMEIIQNDLTEFAGSVDMIAIAPNCQPSEQATSAEICDGLMETEHKVQKIQDQEFYVEAASSFPHSDQNHYDRNCRQCVIKQKDIENFNSKLQEMRSEFAIIEEGLKDEAKSQNQILIDLELEILDKENNLALGDAELSKMNRKIENLKECVAESHKLMQNFQKISDEVEVTRPLAERAPQLETALQHCMSKLDGLANVRSQLIAESNAHSTTYSQYLEVQKELEILNDYKQQLESYQKQYN